MLFQETLSFEGDYSTYFLIDPTFLNITHPDVCVTVMVLDSETIEQTLYVDHIYVCMGYPCSRTQWIEGKKVFLILIVT